MGQIPDISIIIPTKNRRELLAQTLDSVRAQPFVNWEAIVVDDGSDDGTDLLVSKLTELDERVVYVRRVNAKTGANVCRNEGARLSRSEFLMFLDSDDLLAPNCLAARVAWLQRNVDMDFIVTHADAFLETPGDLNRPASIHSLEGDLDRFLYFDLPWLITGPTWRRDSFWALGGFNEEIPSWQDMELHIRAILRQLRYQNLPITDYHVRWQNDPAKTSLQQRRSAHHLQAGEKTVDSFERLLMQYSQANWTRLRAIASLRFMLADLWVDLGKWSEARRLWRSSKSSLASSAGLYYGGLFWLLTKRLGLRRSALVQRACHYWKGCVRLRIQPRLLTFIEAKKHPC